MKTLKILLFFSITTVIIILTSCVTTSGHIEDYYSVIEQGLSNNEFFIVVQKIDSSKKTYRENDRLLYYLDKGTIAHFAQSYDSSNILLSEAERIIEENYTKSLTQEASSYLVNDYTLEYGGEDYEDLFINLLKSINYIHLGKSDESMVEIRRLNNKLTKLETKYESEASCNSTRNDKSVQKYVYPLGNFISMISYYQEGKFDDALIDKNKLVGAVSLMNQDTAFITKLLTPPKKGKPVFLLAFAGWGPVKTSVEYWIWSFGESIYVTKYSSSNSEVIMSIPMEDFKKILLTINKGDTDKTKKMLEKIQQLLPIKFAVPVIWERNSIVYNIEVYVDGQFMGKLNFLDNLAKRAELIFDAKKNKIYAKSAIRALIKTAMVALAQDEISKKAEEISENAGKLAGLLTKVAGKSVVSFTEDADIRCFRLMPGKVFVGRLELKPGKHNIRLNYIDASGNVVGVISSDVNVASDKLNLVEGVLYK